MGRGRVPARVTPEGGARKSGRGCRCSCLGCLLVLVLLIGGLIAAWFVWGQPWLARQRAMVDRAVPGLGVVIDLARGRAPFVSRSLPTAPKRRGEAADFAADVWLPDSRYGAAYHVGEGTAVAVFDLPAGDEAGSAAAWRREMSARGWHRTPVPDPPDGIALLFEREGARCSIELIPVEDGVVRTWLRLSAERHR